jgi:hypothetical protein
VPVEDNWRWLHWWIPTPTPNALQDGADGFVHGLKIHSAAPAVKRYKTSGGGRLALKLFEHIADNRQTEYLLFFQTIGSNHDRWLIRDGVVPTLTNDPQGITIRCNIRSFEVGFREDLDAGGESPVVV